MNTTLADTPPIDAMIWIAFALGILVGAAIMFLVLLYQVPRSIRSEVFPLKLALACGIAAMCEDAQDGDGFSTAQIDHLQEFAHLIGIELHETEDQWGESHYTLQPHIGTVIGEIKREMEW